MDSQSSEEINVFVQARMGSTRLPGKVLKDLNGRPLLGWVVNRLERARRMSKSVILTSNNKLDDPIQEFAMDRGIEVFRGSETDVLDRFYQAGNDHHSEAYVRICADSPLIDPDIIDHVIEVYQSENPDFVGNTIDRTCPSGISVELFTKDCLSKTWKNTSDRNDREHVTPYMKRCEQFRCRNVQCERDYSQYDLAVDTPEDFMRMEMIVKQLGSQALHAGLREIICSVQDEDVLKSNE